MSEHKHYKGGHEMDDPPTRHLFNVVGFLGSLTLLAVFALVQVFYAQRDSLEAERFGKVSRHLAEYTADQDKQRFESGQYELNDDGKIVKLNYIPLARATEKVLENPALLKAGPPPPGFVHPDGAPKPPPAPPVVKAPPPPPAPAGAEGATASPVKPAGAAKPAKDGAKSGR
ncbi:MAG TPA: hypothetical protein ENJ18_01895 [Nannocystis exedens]|nr:hypothetical protein [Nannocystis exedens]